jgi:hypothetical protein
VKLMVFSIETVRYLERCSPDSLFFGHLVRHGRYADATRTLRGRYVIVKICRFLGTLCATDATRTLRGRYADATRTLRGHHATGQGGGEAER